MYITCFFSIKCIWDSGKSDYCYKTKERTASDYVSSVTISSPHVACNQSFRTRWTHPSVWLSWKHKEVRTWIHLVSSVVIDLRTWQTFWLFAYILVATHPW